jgi:hypothetical protein
MTGPSRERPARRGRGTGSGGRKEGGCGRDYDDLELDVDESGFFLVLDDELSDFVDSVVVDDESDESDFVPSDFDPDSVDESVVELPFERFAPLRLSFL